MWHRYVAVGDSFTEGMSDPDPRTADRFIGWADRLALSLSRQAQGDFQYANLAVRGRLLNDVIGPQLDAALDMEPDLISLVGGGNDLLRPNTDPDELAARLESAVVRVRSRGIDVLLATPTDTKDAGVFRALRGRHTLHTANVFTIAQRHGCYVLNLWGLDAIRDWSMWGQDRIHLTTEGHQVVARQAEVALGIDGSDRTWAPAPPANESDQSRWESLQDSGRWVGAYFVPWVQRRARGQSSGDNIVAKRPTLSPLSSETIATIEASEQPAAQDN